RLDESRPLPRVEASYGLGALLRALEVRNASLRARKSGYAPTFHQVPHCLPDFLLGHLFIMLRSVRSLQRVIARWTLIDSPSAGRVSSKNERTTSRGRNARPTVLTRSRFDRRGSSATRDNSDRPGCSECPGSSSRANRQIHSL